MFFQVFVTAGLGGMSGAQAKAAVICGCVGVIAEVVLLCIVVVVVDVVIVVFPWPSVGSGEPGGVGETSSPRLGA